MSDFGPLDVPGGEVVELQAICTGPGGTVFSPSVFVTIGCDGMPVFVSLPDPDCLDAQADQCFECDGGTITGFEYRATAADPWQTATSPLSFATSVEVRAICTGPGGTTTSSPVTFTNCAVSPLEFTTTGSQILTPEGDEFWGAGMNTAFNLIAGPFVFQGFQGGGGPCNGAFDTPASQGAGCVYQGGGINGNLPVFDPVAGSVVSIADRYYAVNGTLTTNAAALGETLPADHWHQRIIRPTLVCEGDGGNPSSAAIIAATIPAIQEALDTGLVVMPEIHDLTGDDQIPTGLWDDPVSSFTGDFGCTVEVVDAIVQAFATTGTGGTTPSAQGYMWINPTNEPWGNSLVGGCPPQAYFDTQTFWIERIRNFHGAENIIVIDLSEWGQNLNGLANGCYDAWWTSLQNHPSGDLTRNVVMSWHAYGAETLGSAYTYTSLDADLTTVLQTGSPGGHRFPLVVGEYGQAKIVGTGNAGPDQWNRDTFEFLVTNLHGQPLAVKHNIHPIVWHATGDTSFWNLYALTDGNGLTANDGLAEPFWTIATGTDPNLTPLGAGHWDVSAQLWVL